MTQEKKDLVIKDLCGRLPYKVIVEIISYGQETQKPWFGELSCKDLDCFLHDVAYKSVKPYLRPMSSMTEEEKAEYVSYCFEQPFLQKDKAPTLGSVHMCIDWLNKKMFDYRGLIEKGLAIEAPEEMYNENLQKMSYKYFPIEFSSYEDYVKYLKEKGFAIEVSEDNNPYKD